MFNEQTNKALSEWLNRDTWDSGHANDEEYFYKFILAAWHQYQSIWDEQVARENMVRKSKELHPKLPGLENIMDGYQHKGTLILDFLSKMKSKL